jgi:hypothetical protein
MKHKIGVSNARIWKTAFIVFAVCLATVVPFYIGNQTKVQTVT